MEFLSDRGARTGLFFGATSGVITTIGLLAGLYAGTNSFTSCPKSESPIKSRCLVGMKLSLKGQVVLYLKVKALIDVPFM